MNRPSVMDSPCAVNAGHVILEMGYQYQSLYPNDGNSSNFPEAEFRLGLPLSNELSLLLPNYINVHEEHAPSISGSSATVVGLKHQFPIYAQKWTYAAESLFTMPSGSDNFGNDDLGLTVNGIVNHT